MSDRPEITVEMLVEHWRRQVQKLREAGIPLERFSDSMRTAALEVEQSWFESILDQAGERLAAIGPRLPREEGGPATFRPRQQRGNESLIPLGPLRKSPASLTESANHLRDARCGCANAQSRL